MSKLSRTSKLKPHPQPAEMEICVRCHRWRVLNHIRLCVFCTNGVSTRISRAA